MRFEHKKPAQTQQPPALIQSRKAIASQNYEAVRVTVQALRRRGTPVQEITVNAVAREAGVSGATIYRRDDLFMLVQKANTHLKRRQHEQRYRHDLTDLQATLATAGDHPVAKKES